MQNSFSHGSVMCGEILKRKRELKSDVKIFSFETKAHCVTSSCEQKPLRHAINLSYATEACRAEEGGRICLRREGKSYEVSCHILSFLLLVWACYLRAVSQIVLDRVR